MFVTEEFYLKNFRLAQPETNIYEKTADFMRPCQSSKL